MHWQSTQNWLAVHTQTVTIQFIFHLFQIQAYPDTGWEIDSQTIGYRMCHISEQMFQLIIGTSLGNIIWNIHNTDIEHKLKWLQKIQMLDEKKILTI
jgi:hypothetical protein